MSISVPVPYSDSGLPYDHKVPSLLQFVLRRIAHHTGVKLKPYFKAALPYCFTRHGQKFIYLAIRENSMDPQNLLSRYYMCGDLEDTLVAQVFVLCDTYMRAKLEVIVDQETNQKTWKFEKWPPGVRPNDPVFVMRCALIESPTCMPLVLTCKGGVQTPRAPDVPNKIPELPTYLINLYETFQEITTDKRPYEALKASRVRGAGTDGVANAFSEVGRLTDHSTCLNPNLLVLSVSQAYQLQGFKVGTKTPYNKCRSGCFSQVDYDPSTSAGVDMHSTMQINAGGYRLLFSNNVKRDKASLRDKYYMDEITAKLRRKWDEGDKSYSDEVYPPAVIMPKVKVEAGGPGDDPNKNRIFMMLPHWAFVLKKLLLNNHSKFVKRKGVNGQGLKWQHGDAQRLYNQLEGYKYFCDYDFSRYDQSLLFAVLITILGFQWIYVEGEDDFDAFCVRHHYIRMLNDLVAKVVQWPDGLWRLIIGMMMSGDFYTATGNETYHITVWVYHCLYQGQKICPPGMEEEIYPGTPWTRGRIREMVKENFESLTAALYSTKDDEIRHHWSKVWMYHLSAGDDGFIALKHSCLKEAFGLRSFKENVNDIFGMLIKYDNCNETIDMTSEIDHDTGEILTRPWTAPDGKERLKPHGIVFLKRHFVITVWNGIDLCVPYRKTDDMWYKLGRTPTKIDNPLMQLIRMHGLMLDSQGTNPWSYNYVAAMADLLLQSFPKLATEVNFVPETVVDHLMKDMLARFAHSGIHPWEGFDIRLRPDFYKMRSIICENSLLWYNNKNFYFVPQDNRYWEMFYD